MCIYVWLIMMIKDSSNDEVFDDIVFHFFYDDRMEIWKFNNIKERNTLDTISAIVKALQNLSIPMYQACFTVPYEKNIEELVFPLIDGH